MNYFDILNVSIGAEPEVIKASYRALAKKYHPDSYKGGKEEADRMMAQINEAYQVLSDEKLKSEYLSKIRSGETDIFSEKEKEQFNDGKTKKTDVQRADSDFEDDNRENNSEYDKLTVFISRVIVAIIIISFIACIIHFGPNICNELIENIHEQIKEIQYSFSL